MGSCGELAGVNVCDTEMVVGEGVHVKAHERDRV